jgi:hypothetical protein
MLAEVLGALPDLPSPEVGTDPQPYVLLLVIGFVVGALGHLFQSKTIIATGILMIVAATIILPLVLQISR